MQHPSNLGKYTITGVLGEGAMGVVYKAFDAGIGRAVAIKTVRKSLAQDSSAVDSLSERFLNEARAVGRLNHPGIVAIYELGEDQGCTFIVMEYVEGRDLSQILASTPNMGEPLVLRVMHQLLDALEYAHQHGVWHRDIKPANLIITAAGQLKITDFGIAKIESAAITQVISTIGTPGYMAPEQYVGEAFDHRVDIFAAGVLLYRMLTGQAPFTGSAQTVMYNIMNSAPLPLSELLPADIASFYEPLVAGALMKEPDQRYANATAFREALLKRKCVEAASAADATIIVQAARGSIKPLAANQVTSRTTAKSQTSQTLVTGWEDDSLAPVRTALANFMGPMAKIVVREAAKKCNDLSTLVTLVSEEITNVNDKAKFLALLRQSANPRTLSSVAIAVPVASPTSSEIAPLPLSAADLEFASLLMAKHIGPIAKIIVKKTAAIAASREQFVALLAQEIADGPKRAQLTTDLQTRLV